MTQGCNWRRDWLWVRSLLVEIKYLFSFIFHHPRVGANCHSTRNVSRVRQKIGITGFPLSLGYLSVRDTVWSWFSHFICLKWSGSFITHLKPQTLTHLNPTLKWLIPTYHLLQKSMFVTYFGGVKRCWHRHPRSRWCTNKLKTSYVWHRSSFNMRLWKLIFFFSPTAI